MLRDISDFDLLFDQEGEEEDFLDEYGNIRPARNETSLPVRYSYVLSVTHSFFDNF